MNTQLDKFNQIVTISSLEIAKITGKRHDNVLADIDNMLAEIHDEMPATDFSGVEEYTDGLGFKKTRRIYNLPKREALILASGYSIKLRTMIIDRLEELSNPPQPTWVLPTNFKEALIQLADKVEEVEKLEEIIESQKEDVEFAKSIQSEKNAIKMGDAAKALDIGRNTLFQLLRDREIFSKDNIPFQRFINSGYFLVKVGFYYHPYTKEKVPTMKPLITVKGMNWLHTKILQDAGIIEGE